MIICPQHKFIFVHIPKCAGTSVRIQIVKCDPDHISIGRVQTHPKLGKLDYGHIPLTMLREEFPDYHAYFADMTPFAVVRDPLSRVGSAIRQVLWQYEQRPMTMIPAEELRDKTLKLLDEVAAQIDAPSAPFIFFARQKGFIYDGDTQVVQHLIPMELVAAFLDHLGQRTGTPLETETRANQNVDLRFKSLGGPAYWLNDLLRRSLPTDLHSRIKDTGLKLLATRKNPAQSSGILDLPELRDFVATYYAEDQAIYDRVSAGAADLERELRENTLVW